MPRELCYLYGSFMEDYLHDINICQQFAKRNREKMAEILLEKTGLVIHKAFQTIHNYIDVETNILCKGSVSAKAGEKLLIPINMRDGNLICVGKGNEDWNNSTPHGAGRLMSRSAAFERLTTLPFIGCRAPFFFILVPYRLEELDFYLLYLPYTAGKPSTGYTITLR